MPIVKMGSPWNINSPNVAWIQGLADITIFGFSLLYTVLAIVAVLALVKIAIKCSDWNSNAYEHFAAEKESELTIVKRHAARVKKTKEILQQDLDDLGESIDSVCAIYDEVEGRFVGDSSVPTDEAREWEETLSRDKQTKLQNSRTKRAKDRWAGEKLTYSALHPGKLYECFADAEEAELASAKAEQASAKEAELASAKAEQASAEEAELASAKEDLTSEINELSLMIDSSEVKIAAEKGKNLNSLLGFNSKFIMKGLEKMAETSNDAKKEHFANPDEALLNKAELYVNKALALHTQFINLKEAVTKQKSLVDTINKKTNDAKKGDVGVDDIPKEVGSFT